MILEISVSSTFINFAFSILLIFSQQLFFYYYERIKQRNIGELSKNIMLIFAIFMPMSITLLVEKYFYTIRLLIACMGGAAIGLIIIQLLKSYSTEQLETGVNRQELNYLRENFFKSDKHDKND